jgi:hypothetical protein
MNQRISSHGLGSAQTRGAPMVEKQGFCEMNQRISSHSLGSAQTRGASMVEKQGFVG